MIGNLTAVDLDGFIIVPNAPAACGLFVDHLIGGKQHEQADTGQASQASSEK